MITLTTTAAQHLKAILAAATSPAAFRLSVKKTGCSGYMYVPEIVNSKKKENDIEIRVDDLLIYLDADTLPFFVGTEIDYVKKRMGVYQLEYHNPHTEGLCGCGESFQIKQRGNDQ